MEASWWIVVGRVERVGRKQPEALEEAEEEFTWSFCSVTLGAATDDATHEGTGRDKNGNDR